MEEKYRIVQHQLALFLHAYKCAKKREQSADVNYTPCNVPHCDTMKAVLDHMRLCSNARQCSFDHCVSTRKITEHWKNCSNTDFCYAIAVVGIFFIELRSGQKAVLQQVLRHV
ncbi:TAZ zinc finger [Aphelenchoides avenae]|nr:TAZ zinc finger [Aphelenchus avenae]